MDLGRGQGLGVGGATPPQGSVRAWRGPLLWDVLEVLRRCRPTLKDLALSLLGTGPEASLGSCLLPNSGTASKAKGVK